MFGVTFQTLHGLHGNQINLACYEMYVISWTELGYTVVLSLGPTGK